MNYTVCRLSNESDKQQLLKCWNENRVTTLDGKYQWSYEDNPAGRAIIFLAKENQTDECIGCFALLPRRVFVGGARLRAGVARDFFVAEKYRILGPAVKLARRLTVTVKENEFDLICAFPNKNAAPVVERAGFKRLGSYVRMTRIIRTSELLRKRHFSKPLLKLLSPLLDAALRLFAFETWHRPRGGFTCQEVEPSDERFDRLCTKARSRFQVMGERTSEFLVWKYSRSPDVTYKIHTISRANEKELLGYIIHCIDDGSIDIRDFILPEDEAAVRVLMTQFLKYARSASVNSVVVHFIENRELISLFKKSGFTRTQCDRDFYYYCTEEVLKEFPHLGDPESWLLSNGEVHYR